MLVPSPPPVCLPCGQYNTTQALQFFNLTRDLQCTVFNFSTVLPTTHRNRKSSHIPSLPVLELMLLLLYLFIVFDVVYAVGMRYLEHLIPRKKKFPSTNMSFLCRRAEPMPAVTTEKAVLTLDHLWSRMKAEAQNVQRINSQHRDITRIMMETRMEARSSLERETSISKTRTKTKSPEKDHIDMVRWAARISADHDPRVK